MRLTVHRSLSPPISRASEVKRLRLMLADMRDQRSNRKRKIELARADIAAIRRELNRLWQSGNRRVQLYVVEMRRRYPELREGDCDGNA